MSFVNGPCVRFLNTRANSSRHTSARRASVVVGRVGPCNSAFRPIRRRRTTDVAGVIKVHEHELKTPYTVLVYEQTAELYMLSHGHSACKRISREEHQRCYTILNYNI